MSPKSTPAYKAIVVDPLDFLWIGPPDQVTLFNHICNTDAWNKWCLGLPLNADPKDVKARLSPGASITQMGSPNAIDVYKAIAKEIGHKVTGDQVRECVRACTHALELDKEILNMLKTITSDTAAPQDESGRIRVYILKTLPAKYWDVILKKQPELHQVFKGVFKIDYGEMARDLREGLRATNSSPRETIFLSPNVHQVCVAKSLGMKGIVTADSKAVAHQLSDLFGDSTIVKAWKFLNSHRGELFSEFFGTDQRGDDARIRDHFSQLLVMQALGHLWYYKDLHSEHASARFRFFEDFYGLDSMGVDTMSEDVGTTALAHLVLATPAEKKKEALHLIEQQLMRGKKRLFCNGGNRIGIDLVMHANILRLAYRLGQEKAFKYGMSLFIELLTQGVLDDDCTDNQVQMFLYFLACLVTENPSMQLILHSDLDHLKELLVEAVKDQVGKISDPLGIAMIALARQKLGLEARPYIARLKCLQCVDGGWEASTYAVYGCKNLRLESRGVTTAFALKAIEEEERITSLIMKGLFWKVTMSLLAWFDDKIPDELKETVRPWIQMIAELMTEIGIAIRKMNPLKDIATSTCSSGYLTLLAVAAGLSITGSYLMNLIWYDGEFEVAIPSFFQMALTWIFIFTSSMVYRHGNIATDWRNSAQKVNFMVEDARTVFADKLGQGLIAVGNSVREKLTPRPNKTIVIEMEEVGEVNGVPDQAD